MQVNEEGGFDYTGPQDGTFAQDEGGDSEDTRQQDENIPKDSGWVLFLIKTYFVFTFGMINPFQY